MGEGEALEICGLIAVHYLLAGQHCYTYSTHDIVVLGDYDLAVYLIFDGGFDTYICGHTTLEDIFAGKVLAPHQVVEIVADQGLAEPVDDLGFGEAELLLGDHIRFGEDGAAAGYAHILVGLQGQPSELLDLHAEPVGLMIEKGACARRTDCIHGKIGDYPVLDYGQLGVLAADFKYGAHFRHLIYGGGGVGCDLILDHICPQYISYQLAA